MNFSQPAVPLYSLDGQPLHTSISKNLRCIRRGEFGPEGYRSGIFIPDGPWHEGRRPRSPQVAPEPGNCLYSFFVSERCLRHGRRMQLSYFSSLADSDGFVPPNQAECTHMLEILNAEMAVYLEQLERLDEGVMVYSASHLGDKPDLVERSSITPDSGSEYGLRGLHVDNWQSPREHVWHRARSASKVLVNFGQEDRYFVYVPITLEQVYEKLSERQDDIVADWPAPTTYATPFGERFMATETSVCLVRVHMPPGSAVVAPVQNIIHDGYPGDKREIDVCFHAQAYFGEQASHASAVSTGQPLAAAQRL